MCSVQVGSSLSDPYLAFAAALNGLAGPLHGLANQVNLLFHFSLCFLLILHGIFYISSSCQKPCLYVVFTQSIRPVIFSIFPSKSICLSLL